MSSSIPVTPAPGFETTLVDSRQGGTAPSSAQPTSRASWDGRRVGHFTIEKLLGRGGMGAVYRARDESLDRPVAIKVLAEGLEDTPELAERFIREARAQARLNSPNIVQIYYIGRSAPEDTQAPPLFFAMELVEGEPLEALLERGEKLASERARQLLLQVATGLAEAKGAGIIHRDIKPSNLILSKSGIVKIADFGLARPLEGDVKITQEGTILGSPLYMAPEQARADAVDHRADMYALGATFYHLVVGSPPFEGSTPLAVVTRHLTTPLVPIASRAPGTSPRLALIVERLLSKEAKDRFESYEELIAALEAAAPRRVAYAGVWTRGAAFVVDGLVAIPIFLMLGWVGVVLLLVYLTVVHAWPGRTLGKLMFKIQVRSRRGGRLGPARAAVRTLATTWPVILYCIQALLKAPTIHADTWALWPLLTAGVMGSLIVLYPASLVMAIFHPRKCALHDLAAGSEVLYRLPVTKE